MRSPAEIKYFDSYVSFTYSAAKFEMSADELVSNSRIEIP